MSKTIRAMYPGRCATCAQWFRAGAWIARRDTDRYWSHDDCLKSSTTTKITATTATTTTSPTSPAECRLYRASDGCPLHGEFCAELAAAR